MRGNFHYNYATGRPCYCGWGRRDHDSGLIPKVAGWQDEWQAIRGRKKLQHPEMQEVLNYLDDSGEPEYNRRSYVNEDTVKWVPWILQKLKNKELNFGRMPNMTHQPRAGLHYQHPDGLYADDSYTTPPVRYNILTQQQFLKTAEFLNSGHRLRREIDPLKTSPQEMQDRVLDWERDLQDQKKKAHRKTGTVVHAYPDGWTMRELAPHELEGEGIAMGSCVGSYPDSVENGDMHILSLRDPKGEPHVTSGTRHDYMGVDHPPGYLYEHKGVGNAEPKPEYNDRFREFWGQFHPHERPLSYDWEEGEDEPEDYHDLATLLNRENQGGEPELDALGLPRQPPDTEGYLPHLDLEDWHNRLTDSSYGGYTRYPESNGQTLMNYLVSTGRVPEYEHQVLYPAEERVYDDAIDNAYANSGGGPYHPEYQFAGPWATQPDFWEEDDWREFMHRHELEDSEEERTKIRDEYEEAEQEQNDAALREDPRYQATSHMFGLINAYNAQQAQLQQQQQRQQQPQQVTGAVHDVTHPHFWYGYPCRCPWGHEDGGEHLGSVKEAAKLDWLRERKDMQDEAGKGFLDKLEGTGYGDADKMLPWIIREWRKNRLSFQHPRYGDDEEQHQLNYVPSDAQCASCGRPLGQEHARFCRHNPNLGGPGGPVQADQTFPEYFTPKHAEEWLDTLKSMKNHRQGVDLMQHSIQELAPKIKAHQELLEQKKREKAGRVTHRFDDGWTVRQLQNKEEAKWEGNEQGNCVGSYGPDIERGDTILMSLRTPDNRPRGTMEIRPGYWFDPKEPAGEDNQKDRYDRQEYMLNHPDRKLLPHPEGGSIAQWYGRSNQTPESEYSDRMREWLDQYADVDRGHWLDREEDFEPWWHNTYEVPGAETPQEYIGYQQGDDFPQGPDEYYDAMADAENHGLEGPDLEYGAPAFDSIWEGHVDPSRYTYMGQGRGPEFDPNEAADLAESARNQGHLGEFYREWNGWKNADTTPVESWEPQYQDAYNWWDKEFKNHINPDTGDFEEPMFRGENERQPGQPSWETALDRWWQRTQPAYPQLPGMEWQGEGEHQPVPSHLQQSMFSRYAVANPPIYYRWALSPETGDVELASNLDDHPALVPGHEELAGRINRPNLAHGYAYRINGGWRLTDWESRPVEDRFTISQIMRALANKDPATPSEDPQEPDWGPASYDFDRTHHGVPQPAGD